MVKPPKPQGVSSDNTEKKQDVTNKTNSAESEKQQVTSPEKPKLEVLNTTTKRTSGLSLKSLRAKKEHEQKAQSKVVKEEQLPTDAFSENDFLNAWNTIIKKTEAKGQMNLASILRLDSPKLNGSDIQLTFPNVTNKMELERESFEVLNYLRSTLNNYSIAFDIRVNETTQKQYAYTTREKFEKMLEKNKHLDLLRSTFDLNV